MANDVVFTLYSGEIVVENHQRRDFASNIGAAPIAMPMWAALSAGASFTPSPVMATTPELLYLSSIYHKIEELEIT